MRRIYKLFIIVCGLMVLSGCGKINKEQQADDSPVASYYVEDDDKRFDYDGNIQDEMHLGQEIDDWSLLSKTGSMTLKSAKEYAVDYYGDYSLVTIQDDRYLVVPEDKVVPQNLDEDIVVLQLPLDKTYLAATAAMDMYRQLGALDVILLTGTKAGDWDVDGIADLIDAGDIIYAGKYNAPDYELLLNRECDIAIESTMIYHNPETKEKLESIGIPVLVERSSYEAEPLGRVEWIKLYGLLTNKQAEAESFMEDCYNRYDAIINASNENVSESDDKKVAYFYISSNGYAVIRKPKDYVSKMIELAGGEYAFKNIVPEEENALSTMNIDMESFYEQAVDADYLIYNSTIDGEIDTIDQLLEKNQVLADFNAVKNGNVWCTGKNMFQETTKTINMIEDFYNVFNNNENADISYMHKLK